jgi:hypothetical protein
MPDRTQFTGKVTESMWKKIHVECDNNGWSHAIPIKIGLEYFLGASREQRLAMLKKYNERTSI